MSGSRTINVLLRLYPTAWRQRYGEELADLIEQSHADARMPGRVCLDVARAGLAERLHAAGLAGHGVPPRERARAGALLALCAWALFLLAGASVQKVSEHWQDVTPAALRTLPAVAFDTLVVAAVVAGVLVLAGIAVAVPSLAAYLRGGGWPTLRRPIVRASVVTALAAAVTVTLVLWAHGLTSAQRDGGGLAYSVVYLIWIGLAVASLGAWTAAAVAAARRLTLTPPVLRLEAVLAAAVAAAMALMTIATAVWWVSLANSAPWFLAGRPVGSVGSPLDPELVIAAALMLVATLVGTMGAGRALTSLPRFGRSSL